MTEQVSIRDGYKAWDPNVITRFVIRNVDYDTLTNIKIRLDGHSDPSNMTLSRGGEIALTITNKNSITYDGHPVQQVDFNDGKTGDDLTCPGYNGNPSDSGAVYYNPGDLGSDDTRDVLSFHSYDFLLKWDDRDGIDGHAPATFSQAIEGNAIVMSIKAS